MLSWLLLLYPLSALGAIEKTHGVHPQLQQRYVPLKTPEGQMWKCLNGSKTIPWSSVNDDFCDCPDGSDEPGTSACPNNRFYCVNVGHIGSFIRSSRVNDGLCEPECCDGSDEPYGVCPNICKQVGEEYQKRVEEEMKLRKTGSKIRSSYISFAKKEKSRLEALVATKQQEVTQKTQEVARLKDVLERMESTSAAELEFKKQSPLYKSLVEHSNALKSLKREYDKLKEDEKALSDILTQLRTGYNPNYQDMAVLEAVRGFEYYAGLPHINERDEDKGEGEAAGDGSSEESAEVPPTEEEKLEEGMWSKERLDRELSALMWTDHTNLLLQHDSHLNAEKTPSSLLFDISSYIPEALVPQYEALKEILVSWLEMFGVAHAPKKDSATETHAARDAYNSADQALRNIKREVEDAERDLKRLYDPEWYGKEGEWKKLAGQCISKDTGEYTYEFCFFEEAKQKPTKGGMNFGLGRFSSWNNAPGVEVGSPEYYSKQHYKGGARCWNGPERSVTVLMSCGTENAILSVSEPEKCEYQFTATTPALCLPPEGSTAKGTIKEEL